MKRSHIIFLVFISLLIVVSFAVFFYVGNAKNGIAENESFEKRLQCPGCNLVIISLTNTRKDHIGIYGYDRNTTPNIDKFFENSMVFGNAFAPASWTLPVAVSLFTSLFPDTHGVMDRVGESMLSDGALTLAEIFKQNGYKTAAFTGGGDYNKKFNHAQGFDTYFDEGGIIGPISYFGIEDSVPQAIDWLNKLKSKNNFFLFIQGFDTHCPFTPIEPFDKQFIGEEKSTVDYSTCLWTFGKTKKVYKDGIKYWPVKTMSTGGNIQEVLLTDEDVRYMISLYDGEIAQADNNLGSLFKIFEEKSLLQNTVFIFMAEHGDMLGEHGRFMRGGPLRGTFYDPVINFPLIIKHPKIDQLVRIDTLVQTVDLMPTLLEMFKLKDEESEKRQGRSLLSGLSGNMETNEYVYAASAYSAVDNKFFDGFSRVEVIRNKNWKLIKENVAPVKSKDKPSYDLSGNEESFELYNVLNDPEETNNLIDQEKDVAELLKKKLDVWSSDKR